MVLNCHVGVLRKLKFYNLISFKNPFVLKFKKKIHQMNKNEILILLILVL